MPSSESAGILGVGVVELEQHLLGVFDERRDAPSTQAQQAKHRQVFGVHREQHVAVQDEGDADVARVFAVVDQEVGADVQLAVVFLVEARRLFQVVVDGIARDGQAESARDPALFFLGGRIEIDPHRLQVRELLLAFDFFLYEPAVGQGEHVQHVRSGERDRLFRAESRRRVWAVDADANTA